MSASFPDPKLWELFPARDIGVPVLVGIEYTDGTLPRDVV